MLQLVDRSIYSCYGRHFQISCARYSFEIY